MSFKRVLLTVFVCAIAFGFLGLYAQNAPSRWVKEPLPDGSEFVASYSTTGHHMTNCVVNVLKGNKGLNLTVSGRFVNDTEYSHQLNLAPDGKVQDERFLTRQVDDLSWENQKVIPDMFLSRCIPVAKSLPPEVREKFAGRYKLK